jgi:NAD(P)-dependent dehydrogenase (short-subunit alcohol dehydrogenase family)
MGRLDNKVAVITGAASGIGRATAIRFAGEGASVVIADLNRDGGEQTARDCKENGGHAVFQYTDVAKEEDIAALMARAVKEFGRINVLYNNAGLGGAVGPIENITVENWDRSMGVLLRSVFLGIKHGAPELRKAGGGAIISTASVAGLRGSPGIPAYGAAKAAVINLTKTAAVELAKDKIRVNCICPGVINTPIIYGRIPGGEQVIAPFLAKAQPVQREGRPDDIASTVLFLASDEAEWITGQAFVIDGGLTVSWGGLQGQGQGQGMGGMSSALMPQGGWAGPSFER